MNINLNYVLTRGVAEIIVKDELVSLIASGKKLRLKEGFDPSSPDIHLGHMVALRKLRQLQDMGHQVVLIVGDWTAQIGDPSGVSITRPMLSEEKVRQNAETYMQQFFKIVDKSKTEVRWQTEWFGDFKLKDVIRLASKFTIAQFLAREDFNKRFHEGRPITITEFLYPLLQAYDSVMVKADVEFGGIDQKFNLLVGRELQQTVGQPPQQIFTVPLLVGTDGVHKMSKSLGNYIGVAEPPDIIFGKVMSIPDDLIMQYFELLTDVPDNELDGFKQGLESGKVNPMNLKKRLAAEVITQLYNKHAATEADASFSRVFQKKEVPEDIKEFQLTEELLKKIRAHTMDEQKYITSISEVVPGRVSEESYFVPVPILLVELGLAKSRSEANRLVEQGAVVIDGHTINETIGEIKAGSIIKVGKRRFAKLTPG